MSDRKEYLKNYHKNWYATVIKERRRRWFRENGPCADCGSWDSLELDHKDPETKTHHAIWSWSENRRIAELEKCKPRCRGCHQKKSVRENRERGFYGKNKKQIIDGKTWCRGHQDFVPVERFDKDRYASNGYYSRCKECRRELPSRKTV